MVLLDAKHHSFQQRVFIKDGREITPEYDFIIVGGGPSGCALATRLSHMNARVLLLEQGTTVDKYPELQNSVALPLQARTLHGSSFDAAYPVSSENQFATNKVTLNSGSVLGGSSCINWAIWTRGPKDDFDFWAQLVNSEAFAWDNISRIYDKIEGRQNTDGPVSIRLISESPREQPGHWSAIAASSFEEAGFSRNRDFNQGNVLGYTEIQESVCQDGRRATANDYLTLARIKGSTADRQLSKFTDYGLDIWTSVYAQRVIFERKGAENSLTAVAVKTNVGLVRASKEIILTAGAIKSAHLLLLSGIGPSEQLCKYGVDVVYEQSEVGENLWDHPVIDIQVKLKDTMRRDTSEDLASLKRAGRHLDEWATKGSGLMSGCPYEWMGFTNVKENIENVLLQASTESQSTAFASDFISKTVLRDKVPHIEHFLHYGHGLISAPDPLDSSYIAVSTVLLTPISRGTVSLQRRSDDGSESLKIDDRVPKIVLNQLKELQDRELLLTAIQKSYRILHSEAWAPYVDVGDIPSRDKIMDFIRDHLSTLWHVGGTCSMKTSYSRGVVDNKLRVIGINGLRVADTSVIPFPIAAHTQAISYALGEIAALFIQERYKI